MKRAHDLYWHGDAGSFLSGLAAQGVDFGAVLRRFVDTEAPFSALLVGSLAERTGNAASDVDLMVILQHEDALKVGDDHPRLDHGKSFEILIYETGIELNIKFVLWRDVLPIKATLEGLLAAIGDPSGVSSIPFLPSWELRFLHKLRSGWLLAGGNLVEEWRDALMTNLLPPYLAVRHFNEFDEWLEDASAMVEEHPASAIYAARSGAESALVALLAAQGFTSPSRKWIFHWMRQCANQEFEHIFSLGRSLLLEDWQGRERGLIRLARELGEMVRPIIAADPVVSIAVARLRRVISYVPA